MSQIEQFISQHYPDASSRMSIIEPFYKRTGASWVLAGASPLGDSRMLYSQSWIDLLQLSASAEDFFKSGKPIHRLALSDQQDEIDPGIILPLGQPFQTHLLAGDVRPVRNQFMDLEFEVVADEEAYETMMMLQSSAFFHRRGHLYQGISDRFTSDPNVIGLVGWYHNQPATTITIVQHGEQSSIWNLATHEDLRGRGLGRATVEEGVRIMDQYEVREMFVTATPEVVSFYTSQGLEAVGTINNSWVKSGLHS